MGKVVEGVQGLIGRMKLESISEEELYFKGRNGGCGGALCVRKHVAADPRSMPACGARGWCSIDDRNTRVHQYVVRKDRF